MQNSLVHIIRSSDDQVVGQGFYSHDAQIFTCAHVINIARNRDGLSKERPDEQIRVSFPTLNHSVLTTIERFSDPSKEDIATLKIVGTPPPGAIPAGFSLDKETRKGLRIHAFGISYERHAREAVPVLIECRIVGPVRHNVVQIIREGQGQYHFALGQSGGPLFEPNSNSIVGMLQKIERSRDIDTAFMIPASKVANRFSFTEEANTVTYRVNFLRTRILTALLHGMVSLESYPLEEGQCNHVGTQLEQIATILTELDSESFWRSNIVKDLQAFRDRYEDWNRSREVLERRNIVRQLRAMRYNLNKKLSRFRGVLSKEVDHEMLDRIFAVFGNVTRDPNGPTPDKFRALHQLTS